jgi:hypothetical protein
MGRLSRCASLEFLTEFSRASINCPIFSFVGTYRNPSLGLATKAKGLQGYEPKGSTGVTPHAPRSAKECEGVNPHILKGVQL